MPDDQHPQQPPQDGSGPALGLLLILVPAFLVLMFLLLLWFYPLPPD
jgi:hypothetical protein